MEELLEKVCPRCKLVKPAQNFKKKRGRLTYCHKCWNKMEHDRYRRTHPGTTTRAKLVGLSPEEKKKRRAQLKHEAKLKSLEKNRVFLWSVLSKAICADCGFNDPLVLQFHHIDPAQKDAEIKDLMYRSLKRIQTELTKCAVLCANCHIRRHMLASNSWRAKAAIARET